ncbi:TIGR02391 family protein [Curtobacterium sp. NPDC089185]|uniref:TIGR02391 family protein n=1 Tax=Curtobacterium sp. NPDC089185 TaxID=3154968 RepID=UPI00342EA78E
MDDFNRFERIVRAAHSHTDASEPLSDGHPFGDRNIHDDLPAVVRELFDNGHYSQSTFEALKFLDEEIQRITGSSDFGKSLMMNVFNEKNPKLALNTLTSTSEVNEQEGFKFIFAGTMTAIRNPRGHQAAVVDDPDTCLDHLGLTSMLLRRLDDAGLR